ncbi:hypothetical protein ACFFX0_04665 [Citricoccus parietis]|uniref:Uncharacterized protein n=1 Tax=Citricoccus parietis TaxID=592307 RepID=A0ABV5FV08_9MICC
MGHLARWWRHHLQPQHGRARLSRCPARSRSAGQRTVNPSESGPRPVRASVTTTPAPRATARSAASRTSRGTTGSSAAGIVCPVARATSTVCTASSKIRVAR